MEYNLALDSGGSKVAALVFDSDFMPVSRFEVGSVRENTTSPQLVKLHLENLSGKLKALGIDRISMLCGHFPGILREYLEVNFKIDRTVNLSELELGLAAALIPPDQPGVIMLSGTGSGIYSRDAFGKFHFSGGYGAAVCDAGSGYDIGRQAFCAAAADFDGYGPHTILTEMICREYGADNFSSAIFGGIYNSGSEISPTAAVARMASFVSKAAESGDNVACEILRAAGNLIGLQAIAHVRKFKIPSDTRITVSGSVWKSYRIFSDSALTVLRDQIPGVNVFAPLLDPLGGAVAHIYMSSGKPDAEGFFRADYPENLQNITL